MQEIESVDIGGATGVSIPLGEYKLLMILGRNGYVMCGYLNMDTADRLGDAACMVTGVSTLEDMLEAGIVKVSKKAAELGVLEGMTGREALEILG